jgi:DNA-binding NtrC family response regulator
MRLTHGTPGTFWGDEIEQAARERGVRLLRKVLRQAKGSPAMTASILGISRPAVYRLIDDLGLGAEVDSMRALHPNEGRGRPPIPRG